MYQQKQYEPLSLGHIARCLVGTGIQVLNCWLAAKVLIRAFKSWSPGVMYLAKRFPALQVPPHIPACFTGNTTRTLLPSSNTEQHLHLAKRFPALQVPPHIPACFTGNTTRTLLPSSNTEQHLHLAKRFPALQVLPYIPACFTCNITHTLLLISNNKQHLQLAKRFLCPTGDSNNTRLVLIHIRMQELAL